MENKDKLVFPLRHAVEKYRLEKKNREIQLDIVRMADEHRKVIADVLVDVEKQEQVQKKISRIVDKWKEDE